MGKTVLLAAAVVAGLVLGGCAQGAGSAGDPPVRNPDAPARADRTAPVRSPGEAAEGPTEGKRTRCEGRTMVDHAFDVTDDRNLVRLSTRRFRPSASRE